MEARWDGLPDMPTEGDDVEGEESSEEEEKEEKSNKPVVRLEEEDDNKPAISKPMLGLMGGVLTLFSVYAFYKAN